MLKLYISIYPENKIKLCDIAIDKAFFFIGEVLLKSTHNICFHEEIRKKYYVDTPS